MPSEKFKASTKYNDWNGTAAADDADKDCFGDWLREQGHMKKGEFLVAIHLVTGENTGGKHSDPIYVHAVIASKDEHDTVKEMIDTAEGPVALRRVDVEMNVLDFFAKFKRIEIAFSAHGMLDGREYSY